jgi:hypothetical protein
MPCDERNQPLSHEVASRLICVPKTAKGPRIIAAEPSEHMFCQNLFADWIIERINDSPLGGFIDLKSQSRSQEMVLKASLDQSLATIDLSSASDRLSLWVVERIFRSNPSILKAIHSSRTRWLRLPNGEGMELKKFASQGTALTFPLQTIVFFVIAMASSLECDVDDPRMWKRMQGKVRVYGDDIIIPNARYGPAVELLTALQLRVNEEKSFSTGHFRESCGVDAFKGYDVTPIRPKTTSGDDPASCQAVLDTINNLFYKGYWYASRQLERRQPSRSLRDYGLVGRDAGATGFGSFSFGTYVNRWLLSYNESLARGSGRACSALIEIRSVSKRYVNHEGVELRRVLDSLRVRYRWNHQLHRIEVRYASIKSMAKERPFNYGYSGLLQRQIQPSDPSVITTSGIRGVPERPRNRKVTRWEALELCVRGAKG